MVVIGRGGLWEDDDIVQIGKHLSALIEGQRNLHGSVKCLRSTPCSSALFSPSRFIWTRLFQQILSAHDGSFLFLGTRALRILRWCFGTWGVHASNKSLTLKLTKNSKDPFATAIFSHLLSVFGFSAKLDTIMLKGRYGTTSLRTWATATSVFRSIFWA